MCPIIILICESCGLQMFATDSESHLAYCTECMNTPITNGQISLIDSDDEVSVEI